MRREDKSQRYKIECKKPDTYKRIYNIWFHLYKIKKNKPISGVRIQVILCG